MVWGVAWVFPDCTCQDFLPCRIQLGLFMFGSCSDAGSLPEKGLAALQVAPLCWPSRYPALHRFSCLVQSLSRVRLFVTPWTAARQASLFIANSRSLLRHMSIESVMPSNYLILCRPLLLLPSIFPSIRVFSNESVLLIRWPKYWSFSFSPSNEYSGLISFRMDWLDLLAVQGTLKSLLQHHSSKILIIWHPAFFIVQFYIGLYWFNPTLGIWAYMYTHLI